jgi:peptide/nickel transport system permease protein
MSNTPLKQDYWSYVKRQFSKNKRAVFSARVAMFFAFIAIFADFIANEKPWAFKDQTGWHFPIVKEYASSIGLGKMPAEWANMRWLEVEFEAVVRAPIPYSPTTQDFNNAQFASPFETQDVPSLRWRHWLGTEKIGRDVLAALVHGTRIAFTVGLVAMSIATFIGVLLGAMAGFFGDDRLRFSRGSATTGIILLVPAYFYAFQARSYTLSTALSESFLLFLWHFLLSIIILLGFGFMAWLLARPLQRVAFFKQKVFVPMDIFVQRLIEILVSIPRLFLIIAIVAIAKPSIMLVMAVIGLTSWTEIARFIRAELLKVRNLEYVEAAQALGYPSWRILFRHAIPNAISPVLIAVAFGIAAAILVEGFLSFIGIGIPPEMLTWGKLLALSRNAPWWFAIAPGFAIFITVTLFNLIGEGLTDALDPRQKK